MFKTMGIIGVGLIGGSLGACCKEKGIVSEIIGFDRDVEKLEAAVKLSVLDRYSLSFENDIPLCDLVVIAAPVKAIASIAKSIKPYLNPEAIIIDVGSVKGSICEELDGIFTNCFVGCHPVAGKEKSGVFAADKNLFMNAKTVITPTKKTDPKAVAIIAGFWEMVGAKVCMLDAYEHDRFFSVVSHLPHMIAFSFLALVSSLREEDKDILKYCGGSMRDFSRVGGSSPEVWMDIATLNKENIIESLKAYKNRLDILMNLIHNDDDEKIMAFFGKSRDIWSEIANTR